MSAQAQRDWPPGVGIRRGLVRVAPTVLAKTLLAVFLGQFAVVLFLDWLDLSWGLGSGLLVTLLLTLLIVVPIYFGMFRPLAAQAARASTSAGEAKYRGLLEAAPDGVVVVDRKGRMVLVNAQAEKMFGYSREEMLGQPIEHLVPQRFHEPHIKHHATYFSKPGTRPMGTSQDLLGRRKDGSEFSVDISLSPFQAEEGLLVTSIIRDITERKQGEEALRESEERFRSVAQSAPEAIILVESKGKIISWNQGAQRMFGYTEEEVLGKALTFLMPERFREAHQEGIERIRSTGKARVIGQTVELCGLRKDSREFPLELSLSRWETSKGGFYGGIIRDITERKGAEEELQRSAERFRQMLEALPVAIRVVQKGVVAFCNSADAALFGYEGPEEIIGTDAYSYVAQDDVQQLREYERRRAAGRPAPTRYEARAKRQDGSVLPVELVVTRIIYGGQPASLTALYDLSERKRLQLYESILPVCCVCGKVRDDAGTEQGKGCWESLQTFVMEHSDTSLSHTFCPPCYQEYRRQQGLPPEEP